jgi:hypothetical protein
VLIGTEQKTSFDRWFPSVEAKRKSGKPDCVEPQRIFVTDQKLSVGTLARGLWDGIWNLSEGRRRRKKKSLHRSIMKSCLQAHH